MSELTARKVERSIRRFRDLAGDVQSATMDTFDDRLNAFFAFSESDSVFSHIHKQLMEMPSVDFQQWVKERNATGGSMVGSKSLEFPTDEEQRLAMKYQLLHAFRTKEIRWLDFSINFFAISGANINDHLFALNRAITESLMRDLEYRLEDVEDDLPEEDSAPISSSVVQIIHNATNVITQTATGEGNVQHAAIHHSEKISSAFAQLRELIETESEDRENDLQVVAAAEAEATSPQSRKIVVRTLLQGLSIAGSAASLIGTILNAIGQDVATKR